MKKKETCGSSALKINNFLWAKRPGQTFATFQRNILQHCCMMLPQVLNEPARRTQHFQRNMWMLMCSWQATSGPSAHALVQLCCVNVAKQTDHRTTSKMLHEKIDRFQIWSNITKQVATYHNISQQGGQTYATCCARHCCKTLRWNVASVWPGLNIRWNRAKRKLKTLGYLEPYLETMLHKWKCNERYSFGQEMVVVMALAWFWVNVQLKTTNPLLAMVLLPLMVQLGS